jgi:hypothetical protein
MAMVAAMDLTMAARVAKVRVVATMTTMAMARVAATTVTVAWCGGDGRGNGDDGVGCRAGGRAPPS